MSEVQAERAEKASEWKMSQKIGFRFVATILLLFMISLPFPHHYIPDIGGMLSPFFEGLVRWSGENIFHPGSPFVSNLESDSTGLYIHLIILFLLSCAITLLWSRLDRKRPNYRKGIYWLVVIAAYYLALQLFEYGFNKVFKWQFYLPEPNTLFTTVGQTPRDLLYWSVMGASRPYTVFSGIMEVLAAALLLFRRTRTLGGLVAFGVLANVVAINFSFDISVKIYSTFLLLLSLIVIAPDAAGLGRLLLRIKREPTPLPTPRYSSAQAYRRYAAAKGIVLFILLFDVLSPYVRSGNFNDDNAPRPPLHGAYEVRTFRVRGDTIPPLTTIGARWRRVFVHREGYLIVQTMDDRMKDYKMQLDTLNRRIRLIDPQDKNETILSYELHGENDRTMMRLNGVVRGDSIDVETVRLDLQTLPLLRNEFHWTTDAL